ncbi:MAG: EAL domain-containing protein, partial [Pseudomonadota bacterium]
MLRRSGVTARTCLARLTVILVALFVSTATSQALEPIEIDGTENRIELLKSGAYVQKSGQSLQVETAPSLDGMTGRMSVRSSIAGSQPDWAIFALRNKAERPLTLWVLAERYALIGSGISWPDLDARRLEAVTPSIGFVPERVKSDRADIFQLTIDPGQTVTYAVELSSNRVAHVDIWQPTAYRLKVRERQLFNGIMLGIAGVLGVFLTAVFAANHKMIFPAAALVAWSVLAYLCVDFGFWHKLFQLNAEDNAVYRAATESAIAASLTLFLYTFLKIGAWGGFIRMIFGVWIIAQFTLVAVAIIDPRLSASFARMSFALLGGLGGPLILFLAIRGQDRALALMSVWILLGVWAFGTAMALLGKLSGELVVSAIVAGLVIVIVLLGFIVTQFAFSNIQPAYASGSEDQTARSLAVEGAGAAVWEWHARRDEVSVSPIVDAMLGLDTGTLSSKLDGFCKHLHAGDKERFLAALGAVRENNGGAIRVDFRMRHTGNFYRWFNLEAASVATTDHRALRCCGLLRDVTEDRRSQDLLLFDAIHDSLTGLPNRELFLDRLDQDFARAKRGQASPPVVLLIDIDKFRNVNATYGFHIGDSLLLAIARRLKTLLADTDTIARIGGNRFGLILQQDDPQTLARLAEDLRRSVRMPVQIGGHDIVLTSAIGAAVADINQVDARDALNSAEIAMHRAKRNGPDQFEVFDPAMREDIDEKTRLEADLRTAIEGGQLSVVYQPIVYLPTENLAGFEALVRWEHPTRGTLNPSDFIPIAEDNDLINQLGALVLRQATAAAVKWQTMLPREENPLFISVNVSSRQLLTSELVQEVRRVLSDAALPRHSLRLELTETLVMENPERSMHMLRELRDAGARIAIDDFGTGYSSLAYLQRFPFDTIKIDREIVQLGSDDKEGSAIVRSIIALAHELGKKVVAEGVETQEDFAFLRSLGCEFGQGFYYGEAMNERDVRDLLKVVRKAERRFKKRMFKPKPVAADEQQQVETRAEKKAHAKALTKPMAKETQRDSTATPPPRKTANATASKARAARPAHAAANAQTNGRANPAFASNGGNGHPSPSPSPSRQVPPPTNSQPGANRSGPQPRRAAAQQFRDQTSRDPTHIYAEPNAADGSAPFQTPPPAHAPPAEGSNRAQPQVITPPPPVPAYAPPLPSSAQLP